MSLMRAADTEVTGRHAIPGTPPHTWHSPARERMLFTAEEDVHDGFAGAWALQPRAPGERETADFWALEASLPAVL